MDSGWHKLAIGDEKPKERTEEVMIKDHWWIGENAMILEGITIGEGAIARANAAITRDVEPGTMVAGSPARVIKENVAENRSLL